MATVDSASAQLALNLIQSAIGRKESDYPGKVAIRN
jgi:hypothetical protein